MKNVPRIACLFAIISGILRNFSSADLCCPPSLPCHSIRTRKVGQYFLALVSCKISFCVFPRVSNGSKYTHTDQYLK